MSYTTHLTTLTARVVVVLAFATSLVLTVTAGFNAAWTGIFSALTAHDFVSNVGEMLALSALFLVIAGFARAVQWVTEQTWNIDLPEVTVPEARVVLTEAVAA